MRPLALSFLSLAVGIFSLGCGLDVVNIAVEEEGQAGGMAVNFPGMASFGDSLGRALSRKDVKPSDVDSMIVRSIVFELTSRGGLTEDLTFIDDLQFIVTADGLAPQLLASQAVFAPGDTAVQLQMVEGLELKPFLKAGNMRIEVQATLAYPPPDVVDLKVTFRIRVDANVA